MERERRRRKKLLSPCGELNTFTWCFYDQVRISYRCNETIQGINKCAPKMKRWWFVSIVGRVYIFLSAYRVKRVCCSSTLRTESHFIEFIQRGFAERCSERKRERRMWDIFCWPKINDESERWEIGWKISVVVSKHVGEKKQQKWRRKRTRWDLWGGGE